jgi:hypothetical protein
LVVINGTAQKRRNSTNGVNSQDDQVVVTIEDQQQQ